MEVWNEYQKVVKNLNDNREMLEEADDDFKEIIKADIESLEKEEHKKSAGAVWGVLSYIWEMNSISWRIRRCPLLNGMTVFPS